MIKVRPGGGLGDHLLLKYEVPTNVESAEQITIGREELEEFIKLRDSGVISPEEFDRIKSSLLQRISA